MERHIDMCSLMTGKRDLGHPKSRFFQGIVSGNRATRISRETGSSIKEFLGEIHQCTFHPLPLFSK
jgi:hypothetical protein